MTEGARAEAAGDYSRAAASYQQAVDLTERFERGDVRRPAAWNSLASMYDALGRYTEAETSYRRAIGAAEDAGGKTTPEYARLLANLGTLYVEMGQTLRGENLLRTALTIRSPGKADELQRAITQNCLAETLSASGKYKEADELLAASLPVLERHEGAWLETAAALNSFGMVRIQQNRYSEAGEFFLRSLKMAEGRLGRDHPLLTRPLNNLATVATHEGRREEAGADLRRALAIAEQRLGTEHPVYARLLANYASYLRETGQKSRARTLAARSSEILRDNNRRNGAGALVDVTELRRR